MSRASASSKPIPFLNWEGRASAFIKRTDWWTPLILLGLVTWSVLAIYSTNSLRTPAFFEQSFAKKQLLFVGLGWAAYWAIALIETHVLERCAWWLYAVGIALLLPVSACALLNTDIAPLITQRFGARRWLSLGSLSLQPSEFAKVSTLILLAFTIGRGVAFPQLTRLEQRLVLLAQFFLRLKPTQKFCAPLVPHLPLITRAAWITALPFALIFVQPDLGSALLYIPMLFAILLIANVPLRLFAILAMLALPGAAVLTADMAQYGNALRHWQETRPESSRFKDPAEAIRSTYKGIIPIRNYHRERIMTLVNPRLIDPDGVGKDWQPRQARMAVTRGGLTGQGFQNGTLVRLGWLPEMAAHTDFLFACIAEEGGLTATFSILGLFTLLIALALRTAAKSGNRFGAGIAAGVAAITAAHVVVNVGMNIGVAPVTGISLPFLSYGGSFILSCFLLFGITQSVHRSSQPLAPAANEMDDSDIQTTTQLHRRRPAV
jgi:rod shape determining protein RodA